MSSIYVIAISTGIIIPAIAFYFHLTEKTNAIGYDVLSGVMRGVVLRRGYRWIVFLQVWLPNVLGLVIFSFVVGFAEFQLAKLTPDPEARVVCHVCAFLMFGTAGVTLIGLISNSAVFASPIAYDRRVLGDVGK